MGERRVFGALLVVALAAALLVPTYPNYDTYWALVWGREALHGVTPSFEAYAAPTPHPLWNLWATLCDLVLGGWADRALVLTCVLAFVGLVWATYRVGLACFGRLSGIVAALCVGSSFAFLLLAARAYVDMPFLCAVLWAAALEAQRPRRGLPVLALLTIAGLLRPEAWLLAGAYWLWLGRPVGLLALLAAAPVLWALSDLVITGDPLFSLHSTSDLAAALGRDRGITHVPTAFVRFLADTARPPVFLLGLLGSGLIWRARGRLRALHVPVALLGGGTVAFVLSGGAGLSILPRYLTVPTVGVCLLAGYAVGGFAELEPGRLRALWRRGAIVCGVLGVAFLVIRAPSFGRLADELRFIKQTHSEVVRLDAARRDRRCAPVTMPTYRLVPDLLFEAGVHRTGSIVSRADPDADPRAGLAVYVVGDKPVRRFGKADGVPRSTNRPIPAGTEPLGTFFRLDTRRC